MQRFFTRLCVCFLVLSLLFTAVAEERSDTMFVEQSLFMLGYFKGACDDVFDISTESALQCFQRANGLKVTGKADQETLTKLNSSDVISQTQYLQSLSLTYANFTPISIGATGGAVTELQNLLKRCNCLQGASDGVFGAQTAQAVMRFQRMMGLPVTGIADGTTMARLQGGCGTDWEEWLRTRTAKEGDTGEDVLALQITLSELGYYHGSCTGVYGPRTVEAVRAFQTAYLEHVSGTADMPTVSALYSNEVQAVATDAITAITAKDDIQLAQQKLAVLGYFSGTADGVFGNDTKNALCLFQLANALEINGALDLFTYEALLDPAAIAAADASGEYLAWIARADGFAAAEFKRIAIERRGQAYVCSDADGFTFVCDVCMTENVPIENAAVLFGMSRPLDSADDIHEGDLLVLVCGEERFFGIATEGGRMVYANASSPWVLESPVQTFAPTEIRCVRFPYTAA